MEDVMNQQRAIGTVAGQRQAVTIARFLMSWYAFSSEEHTISSSVPCFTAFCRVLPCFAASVLCSSAMVRVASRPEQECIGPQERKLAILVLAGELMKSAVTHGPEAGNPADFSVFASLFWALFSFPFRFGGQPKRYMDCMEAARACSMAQHRQIPDEKHVGFLPCARRSSQAHLAEEATRLARHRRYLIPDLDDVTTTNVNSAITSVVVLPRPFRYTFLRGFRLLEEKYQWQKFRITSCRRRSIGTTRPGYISVPIGASKELRHSVLDFPEGESYSFQKQKTRLVVW
jgi:hypothetical protein